MSEVSECSVTPTCKSEAEIALRMAMTRRISDYDEMGRMVPAPIADVLADADAMLAWLNTQKAAARADPVAAL